MPNNNQALEEIINQIINRIDNNKKKPKTISKQSDGTIEIKKLSELNRKIISGFYITVEKNQMSVHMIKIGETITVGELTNIKSIEDLNKVFKMIGIKTRIVLKEDKFLQFKELMEILSENAISNVGGFVYVNGVKFAKYTDLSNILGKKIKIQSEDNNYYILENDIQVLKSLDKIAYTVL